uniref:Secreted protein n=1 Tax=Anopheles darlingi TaxID=43151 RepID=A0A2M4DA88_ANODA
MIFMVYMVFILCPTINAHTPGEGWTKIYPLFVGLPVFFYYLLYEYVCVCMCVCVCVRECVCLCLGRCLCMLSVLHQSDSAVYAPVTSGITFF